MNVTMLDREPDVIVPSLIAQVRIKQQYGQTVIEPACGIGREFAKIAGTKMLTQQTIDSMKRLGYTIAVEQTLPKVL